MMTSATELRQKSMTPSWKEESNGDFNCVVSRDTEGNSSLININPCSTSTSQFHLCNWNRNMKRSKLLYVPSVHDLLTWIENLNLATSSTSIEPGGWFTMTSGSRQVLHQNWQSRNRAEAGMVAFSIGF